VSLPNVDLFRSQIEENVDKKSSAEHVNIDWLDLGVSEDSADPFFSSKLCKKYSYFIEYGESFPVSFLFVPISLEFLVNHVFAYIIVDFG
jgi:hypothetical protein